MVYVTYKDKMYQVKRNRLSLKNKGIVDISEIGGLENLKTLIYLDLSNNNITEVKGLENLRNLKRFDLGKKHGVPDEQVNELKRSGIKTYGYKIIGFFIVVTLIDLIAAVAIVVGFNYSPIAFFPTFGFLFIPVMCSGIFFIIYVTQGNL